MPRWRPTWRWVLFVVGTSALLISILLPTVKRLRDPYRTSGRQPCPSNLRQIGQALLLYSRDHGGVYPTTLDALVTPDLLTNEVLVCYYTRKPFVFVAAAGIASSYGDEDLIVYEPLEAHDGEGSYLLFGSGRTAWEHAAGAQRYIARAATRPSTRPSN
jgi:hypothetical protein